jgi:nucleotide-binding universal stress UspA family protein
VKPFKETARRHRVPFSHQIAVGGQDIAKDALKVAKKAKADLIGLAGKSGRLKTRLLGSVTKSLLQQTKLPLWIKHCR